jgi:enolase-phosphatase E1
MIRAVLTDIEGTTSSISFVKEVLFPYAAKAMLPFLEKNWQDENVIKQIEALRAETEQSVDTAEQANAILQSWIKADKKATALKALQGMIWKAGYEDGSYRAHMYPDVDHQLRKWQEQGIALYVYSSGSIAAQKLFFRHSEAGDLTPLFTDYFDTTSGGKREEASYRCIAQSIGFTESEILFLSDIKEELDAAKSAGMKTMLLDRQHTSPPSIIQSTSHTSHPCVDSFSEIKPR